MLVCQRRDFRCFSNMSSARALYFDVVQPTHHVWYRVVDFHQFCVASFGVSSAVAMHALFVFIRDAKRIVFFIIFAFTHVWFLLILNAEHFRYHFVLRWQLGLRGAIFDFFQALVQPRRLNFDVFQTCRAPTRCILMFLKRCIAFCIASLMFVSSAWSRSA